MPAPVPPANDVERRSGCGGEAGAVVDDSVSSGTRAFRRLPCSTTRPSTRRWSFERHDYFRQREAAGGDTNRSTAVSGFTRQETPPPAGEDVIFHPLAHATSPAMKKKKRVVNPFFSLFLPAILLSRLQAPMTLNAQRVLLLILEGLEEEKKKLRSHRHGHAPLRRAVPKFAQIKVEHRWR